MGKWYVRQVVSSPKSVNGAKAQMRNTDTECYQNVRKKWLCFVWLYASANIKTNSLLLMGPFFECPILLKYIQQIRLMVAYIS